LPWRFAGLDDPKVTAAPVLGQHNTYVYCDLLGLSESEVQHLIDEQIIY
jgi:crotonobetainyl-CoA:carnitine CoA-transferase CaiB-like acyl-CoA transferase